MKADGPARLVKEHSGLLADDGLRASSSLSDLERTFEFDGSAPATHRRMESSSDGLAIGVQNHAVGVWEGFFAVSRTAYPATSVFHVAMTRAQVAVPRPDQSGEAVFAVQTSSTKKTGALNYVLAASTTNNGNSSWVVGHAKGFIADVQLKALWGSEPVPPDDAEVAQEITVRTDGQSRLSVWFGSTLVYAADDGLELDMDPPFQPYLEVQALEIGYTATFTDYWVSEDDSLVVRGLRPGEHACLTRADGIRSRAVACARGEARFTLQMPFVRGQATLSVDRGSGLHFGPFAYAGGDAYRLTDEDEEASERWPSRA